MTTSIFVNLAIVHLMTTSFILIFLWQDGRVVEEEVPTVTVDTSEDKQTFETDHDEDRYSER